MNKPSALGEFLRPGISAGGVAGVGAANRDAAGSVSVLCFKDPDQKALGETTEDLAVLSFLLSRNLEQAFASEASDYKLGIPMLLTSGKQAVGASYIQDFGVILKMQVRFPVVAPPEGAEEAQSKKTGSEWEEARQELLADDNTGASYWGSHSQVYAGPKTDDHGYDAKLVQTLKNRVLVLLKNAANLRHVDDNEWIIVKIVGTPNPAKPVRTASVNKEQPKDASVQPTANEPNSASAGESSTGPTASALPAKKSRKHSGGNNHSAIAAVESMRASARPTVMTLRVKKSAADAFAAGALPQEQFIEQAEVATYLNPLPTNPRVTALSDNPGY